MEIQFANQKDIKHLSKIDVHISTQMIKKAITDKRIIVAKNESGIIGCLRWNYFWDSIPFMNLIYVLDSFQRKGVGRKLEEFWSNSMKKQGYNKLLLSTMSNEESQHFYRKLGYRDIGGFVLPNEPIEVILIKEI